MIAVPGPVLDEEGPAMTAAEQPQTPADSAPRHEHSRRGPVTDEQMACPLPRVPFVAPGSEPAAVAGVYEENRRIWGTVPRYVQLLAHVPAAAEMWTLMDREIRHARLREDPEHVRLQELAIIKTSLINQCNN
jgi:hypothetical protein